MKVLDDYYCIACGLTEELFVDNQEPQLCRNCGELATKVRSVPNFYLPGNGTGFPTADDKWVKKREEKMAQELKSENA